MSFSNSNIVVLIFDSQMWCLNHCLVPKPHQHRLIVRSSVSASVFEPVVGGFGAYNGFWRGSEERKAVKMKLKI